MTAFKDYMWELLTRPFRKDKSVVVKSYTVITGAMLDDVKACIFRLRRQWLVQTAGSEALRMLGDERGIYRYDEEPLEIFRNRVQGAYEMYALGGTRPGMIRALQALGYAEPEITERTPTWSRFRLTLPVNLPDGFTPEAWQRIRSMVWMMKPAHTMPAYTIRLKPEMQDLSVHPVVQISAEIFAKWDFWWLMWKLYRLDGSLRLDGSITLGDGWYETPIYLDGGMPLNGTSLMDGFTRLAASVADQAHSTLTNTRTSGLPPRNQVRVVQRGANNYAGTKQLFQMTTITNQQVLMSAACAICRFSINNAE